MELSLVVSTAYTLLLLASKATTMFRLGVIAIRPGLLPALIRPTRGNVSFWPSTIASPPNEVAEVTPWEANTRFTRWLGGRLDPLDPPQEIRLATAHKPTIRTRMLLFKRRAPNNMKKGDLSAKWWIIADPNPAI